jgi:hypothetical protein
VRPVINPHRTELAEEVLAQQSVEVYVKHLLQFIEVHDGDLLRSPHILGQADIGGTPQRISGEASGSLAVRHALQFEASVTVNFCAHDGSVGAGIQQECGGVTIQFALDDNERLHGAKGNSNRAGMRGIRHRRQKEQQESQRARKRQATLGARRNTPDRSAACIQNGGAAGSRRTERAGVKCVQIKLSGNGWKLAACDQRFSRHDATLGQRRKTIYPFVAFELQKRRHNELVYQTLSQTAPADAHL